MIEGPFSRFVTQFAKVVASSKRREAWIGSPNRHHAAGQAFWKFLNGPVRDEAWLQEQLTEENVLAVYTSLVSHYEDDDAVALAEFPEYYAATEALKSRLTEGFLPSIWGRLSDSFLREREEKGLTVVRFGTIWVFDLRDKIPPL